MENPSGQDWLMLIVATGMLIAILFRLPAIWRGDVKIPGAEAAGASGRSSVLPHISVFLGRVAVLGVGYWAVVVIGLWAITLGDSGVLVASDSSRRLLEVIGRSSFECMKWLAPALLFVGWTGYPEWLVPRPYRKGRS